MDEAQIKELLQAVVSPLFAELKTTITSYVDQTVAGVRSDVDALRGSQTTDEPNATDEPDGTDDPANGDVALKAMKRQLKEMKEQLAAKDQSEKNARLESSLSTFATENGIIAPGVFSDVVKQRFGSKVVESDGAWYIKDGESVSSLSDKLTEFLGSNEGKALLPASGTNGSGTKETAANAPIGGTVDPWAELAASFQ